MTSPDAKIAFISENYFFINNCFGSFFKGLLNWFGDDFYPYFNYKVIGTYSKSIEFFNKKKQLKQETEAPILPSITLDPMLDFSPEERGGRFLWQVKNLSPGLGARMFEPIDLKEQDVYVTPVFSRYQGTIDITFWLRSVYELLDFRVNLLQFCGGYGRYIRPKHFWSFIILPDSIKNFQTGDSTTLDWGNVEHSIVHMDSTNQNHTAIPVVLSPILKLDSLADGSTKYGGDQISEFKMVASFTYEIELPTYMVLQSPIGGRVIFSFSLGNTYTKYGGLLSTHTILEEVPTVTSDENLQKISHDGMKCYRITKEAKDNATLIIDLNTDCSFSFPDQIQVIDWNPIKSGKLVVLSTLIENTIEKGDIIYCENYNNNYISFLRKCGCILCKNGEVGSTVHTKCQILNKPLISKLPTNIDVLLAYEGQDITVDVIHKKVYAGILDTEEIPPDDPEWGYDLMKNLRSTDPKLIEEARKKTKYFDTVPEVSISVKDCNNTTTIATCTDGVQKEFVIPIDLPPKWNYFIFVNDQYQDPIKYIISGNNIIFGTPPSINSTITIKTRRAITTNVVYKAIYEFTPDDLERKSDDYIVIPLPFVVKKIEELLLVSYNGQMEYERDYLIDTEAQTLTIKLVPKENEAIEIYQYVE